MTDLYSSTEPEPLKPDEYFDHDNGCEVRSVIWQVGDAFCPKCGEMGAVYVGRPLMDKKTKEVTLRAFQRAYDAAHKGER